MSKRTEQRKIRRTLALGSVVATGVLMVASTLIASPANADESSSTSSAASDGSSSSLVIPVALDSIVSPDKGGTGGACGMLSLNARLHSKQCNPRLNGTPIVLSRCTKLAIAAGGTAATTAAVTTTPLDWPGIVLAGTVSYLGTKFFCEVAFE